MSNHNVLNETQELIFVQSSRTTTTFSSSQQSSSMDAAVEAIHTPRYCERISLKEYEQQAKQFTEQQVHSLQQYILSHPEQILKTKHFIERIKPPHWDALVDRISRRKRREAITMALSLFAIACLILSLVIYMLQFTLSIYWSQQSSSTKKKTLFQGVELEDQDNLELEMRNQLQFGNTAWLYEEDSKTGNTILHNWLVKSNFLEELLEMKNISQFLFQTNFQHQLPLFSIPLEIQGNHSIAIASVMLRHMLPQKEKMQSIKQLLFENGKLLHLLTNLTFAEDCNTSLLEDSTLQQFINSNQNDTSFHYSILFSVVNYFGNSSMALECKSRVLQILFENYHLNIFETSDVYPHNSILFEFIENETLFEQLLRIANKQKSIDLVTVQNSAGHTLLGQYLYQYVQRNTFFSILKVYHKWIKSVSTTLTSLPNLLSPHDMILLEPLFFASVCNNGNQELYLHSMALLEFIVEYRVIPQLCSLDRNEVIPVQKIIQHYQSQKQQSYLFSTEKNNTKNTTISWVQHSKQVLIESWKKANHLVTLLLKQMEEKVKQLQYFVTKQILFWNHPNYQSKSDSLLQQQQQQQQDTTYIVGYVKQPTMHTSATKKVKKHRIVFQIYPPTYFDSYYKNSFKVCVGLDHIPFFDENRCKPSSKMLLTKQETNTTATTTATTTVSSTTNATQQNETVVSNNNNSAFRYKQQQVFLMSYESHQEQPKYVYFGFIFDHAHLVEQIQIRRSNSKAKKVTEEEHDKTTTFDTSLPQQNKEEL